MKKFLLIASIITVQLLTASTTEKWVPVSGDWTLKNSIASEYSDKAELNNAPRVALASNSVLTNGTVEVTVSTNDGVGDIYLIGRWCNSLNYYATRYSDPHNKLTLLKVVDGREIILEEVEKSVTSSPKVAPLRLKLTLDGDRLTATAGTTSISSVANDFSRGASGVGARYRQCDFSDFSITPLESTTNNSPVQLEALENYVFTRNKKINLALPFKNLTSNTLNNLKLEYKLPNKPVTSTFISLAPNATKNIEIAIDANSFKNGDYFVDYKLFKDNNIIAKGEAMFTVTPQRNPQRFEQILWDNIENTEELNRLGFTAASNNFFFTSLYAKDGDKYAQSVANTIKSNELRLRYNIDNILKIDSQRYWDKNLYGQLFMKDNQNKNQLTGHICNNHPEFKKIRNQSLDAIGKLLADCTSIKYILYDSETENEERKLFQCNHQECIKLAKNAKFDTTKLNLNRTWNMVGSSLFSNPTKAGVKSDGTIADSATEIEYIKWWWLDGSGFVNNRQEMAKYLNKYLPNAQSFHDPLLRAPAFLGRAKGLDFVSQWTYTNPSPLSIIENIDELQAATNDKQGIVPDIQLFWYTNEVIGDLKSAEDRKRLAVESSSVVEARDAVHFGRFVTISPDHLTQSTWLAMSRPIKGIMFDGGSAISDTPGTYANTNSFTPEALFKINRELIAPYGPMLNNMMQTPKKVAMLQSVYSSLYGRTGNYGNANKVFADWYNSVSLAQIQPEIIWDESIDKLDSYEVLIVGDTTFLSDSTAAAIQKFANSGKLVIVGKELKVAIDKAVTFEMKLTEKLDAATQSITWRKNAKALKELLAKHHYHWSVESPSDNLIVAQRIGSGDQTIFLINDARVAGDYVGQYGKVLENIVPQNFKVKIDNPNGVIYDVMQRRELCLDKDSSCNLFISGGKLLYVASSKITGLEVQPSASSIKASESISLAINLTGEKQLKGSQAIKVTLRDANGMEVDSSGYYTLTDGKLTLQINTAQNDAQGYWQVTVEDLIANFRAETTFLVQ